MVFPLHIPTAPPVFYNENGVLVAAEIDPAARDAQRQAAADLARGALRLHPPKKV